MTSWPQWIEKFDMRGRPGGEAGAHGFGVFVSHLRAGKNIYHGICRKDALMPVEN